MAFKHVGWQRQLRNPAHENPRMREWSEWKECSVKQADYARLFGKVEDFPTIEARVRKIYASVAMKKDEG